MLNVQHTSEPANSLPRPSGRSPRTPLAMQPDADEASVRQPLVARATPSPRRIHHSLRIQPTPDAPVMHVAKKRRASDHRLPETHPPPDKPLDTEPTPASAAAHDQSFSLPPSIRALTPLAANASLTDLGQDAKPDWCDKLVPSPRRHAVDAQQATALRATLASGDVPHRVLDLTPLMQVLWQGDDSAAFNELLMLPANDCHAVCPTLGVNSMMLAHRLQRRDCARLSFVWGLWRPVAICADAHNRMPPGLRGAIEAQYINYLQANALHIAQIYTAARALVDAVLAQAHGDTAEIRASLQPPVAAEIKVPLLPAERRHIEQWIDGAVLGGLLARFDQDSLRADTAQCALLLRMADRLDYPLDREHFYLFK